MAMLFFSSLRKKSVPGSITKGLATRRLSFARKNSRGVVVLCRARGYSSRKGGAFELSQKRLVNFEGESVEYLVADSLHGYAMGESVMPVHIWREFDDGDYWCCVALADDDEIGRASILKPAFRAGCIIEAVDLFRTGMHGSHQDCGRAPATFDKQARYMRVDRSQSS
jgi:hypothetical protein